MTIPDPIFKSKLPQISWKKIYAREYGVSYSEGAILCLSPKFEYHIPKPSLDTIVIPEDNNTAFYIDSKSWEELVASLNKKYTSRLKTLKNYEQGFEKDGQKYLSFARKINATNLAKLANKDLKNIYVNYQDKLLRYSVYAWTSYILNNYISETATKNINKYIEKHSEDEKQKIYNSLFHPTKKAAVLHLQYQLHKTKNMSKQKVNDLYKKYKWLSCLDIHNNPWTKKEFESHIKSLRISPLSPTISFRKIAKTLKISSPDLEYLLAAQRFVYIKDARDDYRRQSVFYALPLFAEIGNRIGIPRKDVSYLQQAEIIEFLEGKIKISQNTIAQRKKRFIVYMGKNNKLICREGDAISAILKKFKLGQEVEKKSGLTGMVASRGKAVGIVKIVRGVKDLKKVKHGEILVAITTHPDYVPAMRKAVAIITDEGGITSHAAIVSREFGIPCIVGTKHATSVLQDGNKIEVNAIDGKIKIYS
ncbi:hypothetical protein HYW54_01785 [Candidatus Gottesmanbacteria bacterium]|nr:hypothetical protein [Candidatus Gottesmanbacteria bacterium]